MKSKKKKKSTLPMPAPRVGDPTPPIFHLLALGVGVGGNASFSIREEGNANLGVFRYQHVGIANANFRIGGQTLREAPTPVVLRHSVI